MTAPLLQLAGLYKSYPLTGGRRLPVLRGVDLAVAEEGAVALVGESGCGKSTLARCALVLDRLDQGKVIFDGLEVQSLSGRGLRSFRRQTQLIFQDPLASLDPRMTVAAIVAEPLIIQGLGGAGDVEPLLEQVGLEAWALDRYPHQLSGGQRQRIAMARALAAKPRLIIADEPASSLDLPTRARVLGLLSRIQQEHGVACLLITHDLRSAANLTREVAVMYLGKIVEYGPSGEVLRSPRHPYSRALLDAMPTLDGEGAALGRAPSGEVPSQLDQPPGCPFHPRCVLFQERNNAACTQDEPELVPLGGALRVACHEMNEV